MDLSLERLKEAVSIREQISALERRLASLFGSGSSGSSGSATRSAGSGTSGRGGPGRRRGPMSAATRAKLAEAARRRWAARRSGGGGGIGTGSGSATSSSSSASKSGKRSGGITPEGRRRLSQMMKARWAARKRAGSK